jgi:hypothetical protein
MQNHTGILFAGHQNARKQGVITHIQSHVRSRLHVVTGSKPTQQYYYGFLTPSGEPCSINIRFMDGRSPGDFHIGDTVSYLLKRHGGRTNAVCLKLVDDPPCFFGTVSSVDLQSNRGFIDSNDQLWEEGEVVGSIFFYPSSVKWHSLEGTLRVGHRVRFAYSLSSRSNHAIALSVQLDTKFRLSSTDHAFLEELRASLDTEESEAMAGFIRSGGEASLLQDKIAELGVEQVAICMLSAERVHQSRAWQRGKSTDINEWFANLFTSWANFRVICIGEETVNDIKQIFTRHMGRAALLWQDDEGRPFSPSDTVTHVLQRKYKCFIHLHGIGMRAGHICQEKEQSERLAMQRGFGKSSRYASDEVGRPRILIESKRDSEKACNTTQGIVKRHATPFKHLSDQERGGNAAAAESVIRQMCSDAVDHIMICDESLYGRVPYYFGKRKGLQTGTRINHAYQAGNGELKGLIVNASWVPPTDCHWMTNFTSVSIRGHVMLPRDEMLADMKALKKEMQTWLAARGVPTRSSLDGSCAGIHTQYVPQDLNVFQDSEQTESCVCVTNIPDDLFAVAELRMLKEVLVGCNANLCHLFASTMALRGSVFVKRDRTQSRIIMHPQRGLCQARQSTMARQILARISECMKVVYIRTCVPEANLGGIAVAIAALNERKDPKTGHQLKPGRFLNFKLVAGPTRVLVCINDLALCPKKYKYRELLHWGCQLVRRATAEHTAIAVEVPMAMALDTHALLALRAGLTRNITESGQPWLATMRTMGIEITLRGCILGNQDSERPRILCWSTRPRDMELAAQQARTVVEHCHEDEHGNRRIVKMADIHHELVPFICSHLRAFGDGMFAKHGQRARAQYIHDAGTWVCSSKNNGQLLDDAEAWLRGMEAQFSALQRRQVQTDPGCTAHIYGKQKQNRNELLATILQDFNSHAWLQYNSDAECWGCSAESTDALLHMESWVKQQAKYHKELLHRIESSRMLLCSNYQAGYCQYGSRCRYLHDDGQKEARMSSQPPLKKAKILTFQAMLGELQQSHGPVCAAELADEGRQEEAEEEQPAGSTHSSHQEAAFTQQNTGGKGRGKDRVMPAWCTHPSSSPSLLGPGTATAAAAAAAAGAGISAGVANTHTGSAAEGPSAAIAVAGSAAAAAALELGDLELEEGELS